MNVEKIQIKQETVRGTGKSATDQSLFGLLIVVDHYIERGGCVICTTWLRCIDIQGGPDIKVLGTITQGPYS